MKGYLFDIEIDSILKIRVAGMSKSPEPFLYPPPTTILGAIASSYAYRKGMGEGEYINTLKTLSERLIALSYRPVNAIPRGYQDINRAIMLKGAGRARGKEKEKGFKDFNSYFDAPAWGKTAFYSIDSKPVLLRVSLIVDDALDLSEEDLWKIRRIGGREGVVSVVNVVAVEPKRIDYDENGIKVARGVTHAFPCGVRELKIKDGNIFGAFVIQFFVNIFKKPIDDSPSKIYLTGVKGRSLEDDVIPYCIGTPSEREPSHMPKADLELQKGLAAYSLSEKDVVIGLEG